MIDDAMGGCPKCGAPVSDEDLACRQCGHSFLGEASAVPPPDMFRLPLAPVSPPSSVSKKTSYVIGAIFGTLVGRLTWRFVVYLLFHRH